MSDFDDESTPPRGGHRPLTDSERQVFRVHYESGVPSVRQHEDADTSPIDLFRRASDERRHGITEELRRDPKKLIPFLGEFAEWVVTRMRERSSSEQDALKELRELLSKPPNGATRRLEEQIKGLAQAVSELAERLEEVEKMDDRVRPIEETIKGVRGFSKAAIIGIITTVAGSAVGIIATLQSKAEKQGAADERAASYGARLDRLERFYDEQRRAPSRRDYDYDITPRPFTPPKKDP